MLEGRDQDITISCCFALLEVTILNLLFFSIKKKEEHEIFIFHERVHGF